MYVGWKLMGEIHEFCNNKIVMTLSYGKKFLACMPDGTKSKEVQICKFLPHNIPCPSYTRAGIKSFHKNTITTSIGHELLRRCNYVYTMFTIISYFNSAI